MLMMATKTLTIPTQECDEVAILATNEPLPPPPIDTLPNQQSSIKPTLPASGEQEGVHHGGQQGGHQRQSQLHHQGPPTASTPVPRQGKTPASTPKRESPATIAAKEAPGWQMFLGVKSSTVSFTSEEV